MGRARQGIWAEHGRVYGQSMSGYMGRACQGIWAEHVRVYGQSTCGACRLYTAHISHGSLGSGGDAVLWAEMKFVMGCAQGQGLPEHRFALACKNCCSKQPHCARAAPPTRFARSTMQGTFAARAPLQPRHLCKHACQASQIPIRPRAADSLLISQYTYECLSMHMLKNVKTSACSQRSEHQPPFPLKHMPEKEHTPRTCEP